MTRASVVAVVVLAASLAASPAAAQGKSGKTPGDGHGHQPGGGNGPETPSAPTPSPATASFNTWIDDATLLDPRTTWIAFSVGEWNSPAGRAIILPSAAVIAGVAPRLGVGAALPVETFRDSTGTTSTSVGDISLFAKVGLVDPAAHAVGLAVTPLIEISTPPDGSSGRQANWALPVSLEVRGAHGRVYGSAGYFSTGSVFVAAALELRPAPRFALTGTLGHTYATLASSVVAAGETRHRTDVSGTAAILLSTRAVFFGSIGHAFSGDAVADGGPWIAAGIAIRTR